MILYGIPDIRLFWSSDERFLSQFKPGEITRFKPYSRYPACFKDIAFWLPAEGDLHDNDFCDLVSGVSGASVLVVKTMTGQRGCGCGCAGAGSWWGDGVVNVECREANLKRQTGMDSLVILRRTLPWIVP